MRSRSLAGAAVLMLALAGCGGDHGDHGGGETTLTGQPGNPDEADVTIEIAAQDPYRFDPDEVDVDVGDTVLFVVTNEGDTDHEFVLGEAEHTHMGEGQNALELEPGDTQELAWTFTESGTIGYFCHLPGHAEGGMTGEVVVGS